VSRAEKSRREVDKIRIKITGAVKKPMIANPSYVINGVTIRIRLAASKSYDGRVSSRITSRRRSVLQYAACYCWVIAAVLNSGERI
jgi:hypothetical protein